MDNCEQNFQVLYQTDSVAAIEYITRYGFYEYSLLEWARSNEYEDVAELLIANYLAKEDADIKEVFLTAIRRGDILIAKWMVKKYELDVHANNEQAFKSSCRHDQRKIAKWLVADHSVDANIESKIILKNACYNGCLRIAKWIVKDYGVDVHFDDEYLLRNACWKGHLKIAKWLVENHAVDVHANNEAAFHYACRGYYKNVIEWFEQDLGSDMRYICHNGTPYIINHEPIPDWQHCELLGCPIAYRGIFNKRAITSKMKKFRIAKSARSAKI